jgi:hypothetical protein
MSQTTLNHLAITGRTSQKPGLFRTWVPGRGTQKSETIPLAITLPVTMAVSLVLWIGLFLAIRALF